MPFGNLAIFRWATEDTDTPEKIRVFLADDHPLVLTGLVDILQAESDIDIVGTVTDGNEAVSKAPELRPDVIVIDIFLPRYGGLEAIVAIKENFPRAKILALTLSEQENDLFQALRFGAQGYLLKSATITEVTDAVRMTAAGEAVLSPTFAARLLAELRQKHTDETDLVESERGVLQLVGEGLTSAQIAQRLSIAESTVRTYLEHFLEKLHLSNRAESLDYARRHHQAAVRVSNNDFHGL